MNNSGLQSQARNDNIKQSRPGDIFKYSMISVIVISASVYLFTGESDSHFKVKASIGAVEDE